MTRNADIEERAAWAADCTGSLMEAIHDAGGHATQGVLNLTLREFIAKVAAQNGIRFVHRPVVKLRNARRPAQEPAKPEDPELDRLMQDELDRQLMNEEHGDPDMDGLLEAI